MFYKVAFIQQLTVGFCMFNVSTVSAIEIMDAIIAYIVLADA